MFRPNLPACGVQCLSTTSVCYSLRRVQETHRRPITGYALRRVTEVLYHLRSGLIPSLATQTYPFLLSPSPLAQASLPMAVVLLWLRFYSRLTSLWGVRYTSLLGGCLLFGLGGGVCSASRRIVPQYLS